MEKYRPQFIKYWKFTQLSLVLFCSSIFVADMLLGDGDGMLEQWSINPLTVFVYGQLFLWLLKGIFSTRELVSKICLALSVLLLGFISINFLMTRLTVFKTFAPKRIVLLDGGYPYTSYDTVYFKNHLPNTRFIYRHPAKDGGKEIMVTINNDGVRGNTPIKEKGEKHRIILLGDSFMQSLQVDEKNTIGKQLEGLLPDSIEIIQHGFGSWSPLLEYNWLLRKGMSFEPDEVVLFLFNNDFFPGQYVSDEFYTKFAHFDDKKQPIAFSFEQSPRPKRNVVNHFTASFQQINLIKLFTYSRRHYLARTQLPSSQIKEKLHCSALKFEKNFAEQDFGGDPLLAYYWSLVSIFRDTSIWDDTTSKRVSLSLGYLESMNNYLQERGIRFSIKLIPFAHQLKNENQLSTQGIYFNGQQIPNTGLCQKLDAFCQEQNIPFLNLYDHFNTHKKQFPDKKLYFNVDGHWNENGHKVAAQAVADSWYLFDSPK